MFNYNFAGWENKIRDKKSITYHEILGKIDKQFFIENLVLHIHLFSIIDRSSKSNSYIDENKILKLETFLFISNQIHLKYIKSNNILYLSKVLVNRR